MILYINKTNNGFEFTHDTVNANYQMLISRIKTVDMQVNKKQNDGSYKDIPIASKEVKELNTFVLNHFKNVIQDLNSLIEV